ncbi:response regulator Mcs4 [Schizosaccharomyces japonicus yFS275]|uniref:Response regulator Mcs4 n=1 Tax=Schizosaccharomyces japonicus (strain yFS275 / FY16936) TaxID=402676 RepID=B6JVB1_SCHJY|nr:response regulator Mcs4 [Schizosaccharomyces japonicus yFS275]EEB05312.2 response regulator Mcs4 [Schizosaccharomyces japonicus yFS275]
MRVWLKKIPDGTVTSIKLTKELLVDDLKDAIVQKYPIRIGQFYDAPDVSIHVVTKVNGGRDTQARELAPNESLFIIMEKYYPGGQSLSDALLVTVPPVPPALRPPYSSFPYTNSSTTGGGSFSYPAPFNGNTGPLTSRYVHENGPGNQVDYFPVVPSAGLEPSNEQSPNLRNSHVPLTINPNAAMASDMPPNSASAAIPFASLSSTSSSNPARPRRSVAMNTNHPSPGVLLLPRISRHHSHASSHRHSSSQNETAISAAVSNGSAATATAAPAGNEHCLQASSPAKLSAADEQMYTLPIDDAPPSPRSTAQVRRKNSNSGNSITDAVGVNFMSSKDSVSLEEATQGVLSDLKKPKAAEELSPFTLDSPLIAPDERSPLDSTSYNQDHHHIHASRFRRKSLNIAASSGAGGASVGTLLDGLVPPIHVLIVEDNIINQKILEAFMKKRNIRSTVAHDGQEALDKWKKGSFHLILMDIQLPVMSGIEATKEIRRLERVNAIGVCVKKPEEPIAEGDRLPEVEFRSPVIIVALTASSLQSDRNAALAAGCNDFLTKPVSLVWLEKKITEWGCMQALIDWNRWRRFRGH